MPSGGVGQGETVFRPGPGGLSLIEDEHSKNSKGELFGLSVTWWDENAHGYRAIWCANNLPTGCIVMAKLAKWEGDQFVLGDEYERNGRKFVFKEAVSEVTPSSYVQTLYQGESGSSLHKLMTIRATKIGPPTVPAEVGEGTLKMPGPAQQNMMLGAWKIDAVAPTPARVSAPVVPLSNQSPAPRMPDRAPVPF